MEFFQIQFPTPSLRRKEVRLKALLRRETERLRENPQIDLPSILTFAGEFHARYQAWQNEALKQHQEPILCAKGCSNCCQHYPMSIEPFEAILLYAQLRQRPDFTRILEECWRRVQAFGRLKEQVGGELNDEQEDAVLQSYFSLGLRCPLLNEAGDCSVHSLRPVTCRMYFSYSDPRFCSPEHLLLPENRSFHICLPDTIEEDIGEINTLYDPFGLDEALYDSLLRLNGLEGDGIFQ